MRTNRPYVQIDPDVLERVRQIDLLSYLREFEPSNLVKVKGTSNVYCTAEHDSLKISNGKWYWWSRGFGGYSALDYLIKVKEYDFVEAVEILTGQTMADWKPPPAPKKDKPKVLLLPPKNKDSIVTEAEKSKDAKDGQPEPDIGVQEKAEKDKLLDELMGKPVQKEENAPNPSVAKTEKSPQSEPTLEQPKKSAEGATMTKEKPSVREELRKIKESRKEQEAEIGTSDLDKSGASDRAKSANRKTEHKQPTRKKKKPKSKETR